MAKKLSLYNKKRDFKITAEPQGKVAKSKTGFSFLIQKHAATRLHYDFRLELDGVLKSWAVTRGPSYNPNDKRLAVEVEDHPLSYGSFEGTIPRGQYGGGTVMLWDQGYWEPLGNPQQELKKGHLSFKLHGQRMHGEWALILMRGKASEKRHNWLLVKKEDEFSNTKDAEKFLEKENFSIVSKRTMDEIAEAKDNVYGSKKVKVKPKHIKKKPKVKAEQKIKAKLPEVIEPQLATLSDEMPEGDEWIHEVKFDGYRVLAHVENGKAKMITRNGNDWTDKFSYLGEEIGGYDVANAIFDGEIVATDKTGNSNFMDLQQALSDKDSSKLQYYIFDLLFLSGEDLRRLPLIERKEKLREVLEDNRSNNIFYSESFSSHNGDFIYKACQMKLEGVVSKLANAPYTSGRSKSWLKSKCHNRQEFVIGGYTLQSNGSNNLGALLVGVYNGDKFVYAGRVGTGFNATTAPIILKKLKKLEQKECPFSEPPKSKNRYGIIWVKPKTGGTWVKPELVCEVEFSEWTRDNILRHPSFQGLREDKKPKQIKHEIAVPVKQVKKSLAKTALKKGDVEVGGVRISHPDRIIYPGTKITKEALADYYIEVQDLIMPHLKNRPISVLRCVQGYGSECFFQRHLAENENWQHIKQIELSTQKNKRHPYIMANNIEAVISLIQMGVLEIHPWGSVATNLEKPNQMIFDLDPAPDVTWTKVISAALEIRERMSELGLVSFVKTTGGKGLHVVIPIKPKYGWETIKEFTKAIAKSMEHDSPKLYLATMSKEARKGKIFVDYLRNERSATAICVYSSRAREGGTVSMPLTWKEIRPKLDPKNYTIENIGKELKKNPWQDFFTVSQYIDSSILKQLQINQS